MATIVHIPSADEPRLVLVDQIPMDNGDLVVWWRDIKTGDITKEVIKDYWHPEEEGEDR